MFPRFVMPSVVGLSFAFVITACSSSSTSPGDGKTSPPAGSSGSSGTSGSSGGAGSSGNTAKGGLRSCGGVEGTTCTQAELDTYQGCIQSRCGSTFAECYGPGYQSGTFSGACGDLIACTNACDCGDAHCYGACPAPSASCQTCMEKIGTCSDACAVPDCMKDGGDGGGGGGGGGASCADLAACCAGKPAGDERSGCEQALQLAAGNELSCRAIHGGLCP